MANEFKLSYTASEINERLTKINTLAEKSEIPSKLSELVDDKGFATEEYVDSAVERVSGNTGDFKGIIDVVELPTENIREDVMYRLISAKIYFNFDTADAFTCYCVESLPETGVPATDATQTEANVYYNLSDGNAYGYVDEMLSAGMSVPVGWYEGAILLGAMGFTYNGVVTDISDLKDDSSFRVLLNYDYYVYKNEWTKLVFAYEKPPQYDIRWNGVIGDRLHLDVSEMFGMSAGSAYIVKVSDEVLSFEQLLDLKFFLPVWSENYIYLFEEMLDTNTYPGCICITHPFDFTLSLALVVYDVESLNSALGLPSGVLTNGIYFAYDGGDFYINRLVSSKGEKIKKIDAKYLDVHDVAISGRYSDLSNKPTIYADVVRYTTQSLTSTQKSEARTNIDVYSKSEVDTKIDNIDVDVDLSEYAKTSEVQTLIANAIGSAIGGGY